jgi:hypothetical protein
MSEIVVQAYAKKSVAKKERLAKETRCAYCGGEGDETLGPDDDLWHVDHVVPKSKRGSDRAVNLVRSCRRCNVAKGVKLWQPKDGTINATGAEYERLAELDALWQGLDNVETLVRLFCDQQLEMIKSIRNMVRETINEAKIDALKAKGFGDTK